MATAGEPAMELESDESVDHHWGTHVELELASSHPQVGQLREAACAAIEEERKRRASAATLERLRLIQEWDTTNSQVPFQPMEFRWGRARGLLHLAHWNESNERTLARSSTNKETLSRLSVRKELVTRLLGSGGFEYDRNYHWSESGWLVKPAWLTQRLQDPALPQKRYRSGFCRTPDHGNEDDNHADEDDYYDYRAHGHEMPITPSVLAAQEEQKMFKRDFALYFRERYGYSFDIGSVDYKWCEFHEQGPGSHDAWVDVKLTIDMDEVSLAAFLPKARAEALDDVLGKDTFLSLAEQGSKAAVAVAIFRARRGMKPLAQLISSYIPSPAEVKPILVALAASRKKRTRAIDDEIEKILKKTRAK